MQFFQVELPDIDDYFVVATEAVGGRDFIGLNAIYPMKFGVDVENMSDDDFLCAPILMHQRIPSRGPTKWKLLHGNSKTCNSHQLKCIAGSTIEMRRLYDWNLVEWDLIENFNPNKRKIHLFCEISHLTDWGMCSAMYVVKYLTFLWLKLKGREARELYDVDTYFTDEEMIYKRILNMRLWSEIAVDDRNRIIPTRWRN